MPVCCVRSVSTAPRPTSTPTSPRIITSTLRAVTSWSTFQMRIGNVDQLVTALKVEVMMRGDVGVEVGLGAVDTDLTQQTGIGQLVQRIVDGGERDRDLGVGGFLVKHLGGDR